jgi:hypothetical protein
MSFVLSQVVALANQQLLGLKPVLSHLPLHFHCTIDTIAKQSCCSSLVTQISAIGNSCRQVYRFMLISDSQYVF